MTNDEPRIPRDMTENMLRREATSAEQLAMATRHTCETLRAQRDALLDACKLAAQYMMSCEPGRVNGGIDLESFAEMLDVLRKAIATCAAPSGLG